MIWLRLAEIGMMKMAMSVVTERVVAVFKLLLTCAVVGSSKVKIVLTGYGRGRGRRQGRGRQRDERAGGLYGEEEARGIGFVGLWTLRVSCCRCCCCCGCGWLSVTKMTIRLVARGD